MQQRVFDLWVNSDEPGDFSRFYYVVQVGDIFVMQETTARTESPSRHWESIDGINWHEKSGNLKSNGAFFGSIHHWKKGVLLPNCIYLKHRRGKKRLVAKKKCTGNRILAAYKESAFRKVQGMSGIESSQNLRKWKVVAEVTETPEDGVMPVFYSAVVVNIHGKLTLFAGDQAGRIWKAILQKKD